MNNTFLIITGEILLRTAILFSSAFMEEFMFRFTIFRFLRRKGFLVAVSISSLAFALLHTSSMISFLSSIVFGFLMSIYYEYSNSLLKTTILHVLHNTVVVGITYGGVLPALGLI